MAGPTRLREACGLFVKLARDAGRELALDEGGVEWAEQYVRAVRPVESADQLRVQTALVGAYLGECLIAAYGGGWSDADGEWAVDLGERGRVHPFRVTEAELKGDDGGGSILSLFRSFGAGDEAVDDGSASPENDPAVPLRETAERFRQVIVGNGGPAEYGEEMVAFVSDFVENARPVDAELADQYTALVGAVLGESLIAAYGGRWSHTGSAWLVEMGGRWGVHPFSAARRQLESAENESILSVFHAAGSGGPADAARGE